MLPVTMDETNAIALLEPQGALVREDFETATRVVDPFIRKWGGLNGLIVHARRFAGWNTFAALASHLNLATDHHRHITRIALVTDSDAAGIVRLIAPHFVNAKIKVYPYTRLEDARTWILARTLN